MFADRDATPGTLTPTVPLNAPNTPALVPELTVKLPWPFVSER